MRGARVQPGCPHLSHRGGCRGPACMRSWRSRAVTWQVAVAVGCGWAGSDAGDQRGSVAVGKMPLRQSEPPGALLWSSWCITVLGVGRETRVCSPCVFHVLLQFPALQMPSTSLGQVCPHGRPLPEPPLVPGAGPCLCSAAPWRPPCPLQQHFWRETKEGWGASSLWERAAPPRGGGGPACLWLPAPARARCPQGPATPSTGQCGAYWRTRVRDRGLRCRWCGILRSPVLVECVRRAGAVGTVDLPALAWRPGACRGDLLPGPGPEAGVSAGGLCG